jgi:hypothetical protein
VARPSRIVKSTIAGNHADGRGGGIVVVMRTVSVSSSTLAGNSAVAQGGGIAVADGRLAITDSTVASNQSTGAGGGGIAATGAGADVSANAITVARNSAGDSGGGLLYAPAAFGFSVENSLIVLNTAAAGPDCVSSSADPFDSQGHNVLSTRADCDGFNAPRDIVRGNPKIGPLRRNGGPTKTIALRKGSPAIGHAKRGSAPNRDQRGRKRDRHPDAGAFER